jgi:dTDP-4-amino-4,6-dideoxygalactose transaminase
MVPLFDLTRQYQELKPEIDSAVLSLLESGQYVLGPVVNDFEAQAAAYLGVKHAIGVANGTDALLLTLRAFGIEAGDEVITTPFTFIATAEVLSMLGARPVFVDIDPETLNLDPTLIEAAITPKTKAIIPVHLFGHCAPMKEINVIARNYGLKVLEDSAQGWGGAMELDGEVHKCGALGDAGSFSFFPSKNLGACGEGGLISTDDDELAAKVSMLRVHGQSRRYIHDEIGYNSRLHAMQAAILNVKMPHADRWNDARRANAARYAELLGNLPLTLPIEKEGVRHVYHQYTLRLSDREPVCRALSSAGVGWAIYYPVPLHLQPVYKSLGYKEGDFPESEQAASQVISLPIFPELTTVEIETTARAIRASFDK